MCFQEEITVDSPLIISFSLDEMEREGEKGKEEEEEAEEEGGGGGGGEVGRGWPQTSKEWWIEVALIPKFRERLSWSWKNSTKSVKGNLLMPLPVFMFFFNNLEKKKETENNITFLIETKQN
jgi:hypothetical protein